jgi:hypothetical protein
LLSLKGFDILLSFEVKAELLKAEIKSLIDQYDVKDIETTLYSKRSRDIFLAAFENLRYKPDILWIS